LIDNGHNWSSIQQYSLSEIGAFLKVIVKKEAITKAESLSSLWMANNISQKALNDILREIAPDMQPPPNDPDVIRKNWLGLAALKGLR